MSEGGPATSAASRQDQTERALGALRSTLDVADAFLKGIPPPRTQAPAELARQLVGYGVATYGLWTARGILELLKAGLSQQSLPLARVLWELRVTLLYVEQDWMARARRFLMHDVVVRHQYLKNAEQSPGEPWARAFLADRDRVEALHAEYRSVVDADPGIRHRHWAGKDVTTRKMAAEVGMEEEYRFLYSWLSERIHGSVRAIGEAFHQDEAGVPGIRPPDYTLEVAATTAAGLCQMLLCLSEIFGLGEQPELQRVLLELP